MIEGKIPKLLPLIAILAVGSVGEVILYVGPFMVGAVIEGFNIDEGTAGLIFGIEIAASAGAAFLAANNLHRLPSRPLILGSILMILIGDATSFFVSSIAWLVAFRVLAAVGAGTIFAAANALAASTNTPAKTYSILSAVVLLTAIVAFILIPAWTDILGPKAVFAVLVAITTLALPTVFWLPPFQMFREREQSPQQSTEKFRNSILLKMPCLLILCVVMLMYAGQNGLWSYVERVGVAMALSMNTISTVLILNAVVALVAPLLAIAAYKRLGLLLPIVLGLLIQATTALVLVRVSGVGWYAITTITLTTFLIYAITLLKISMAVIDPSGRVVGTSTGLITLGSAAGPLVAGILLSLGGNYVTLGSMTAGCMLLAMALTTKALMGLSQQAMARQC